MTTNWRGILALVAFLAILIGWNFIADLYRDFMSSIGQTGNIPWQITVLVFLLAIGAAAYILMSE